MSTLDYALKLRAELIRNPFLEFEEEDSGHHEPDGDAGPGTAEAAGDEDASERSDERELFFTDAFMPGGSAEHGDEASHEAEERDSWADVHTTGAGSGDGDECGDFGVRSADYSLAQHLHGQIGLLPLEERDRLLARAIDSLDDDGYLRLELDELIAITALDPTASDDELRIALCRVQSL